MSDATPRLDRFLEADSEERATMLRDRAICIEVLESVEQLVTRDAGRAAEAGRRIGEASEDGSTGARALRATTTALAYLGRFDEAIGTANEARERAIAADDPIEAARALVAAMHPRCETGRLDEAIEGGETARRELISAGAEDIAVRVDLNLGNIRKMQGDASRALEHLDRVIAALDENDPIRPHALNAIGECRHVLDDLVAADEAFAEAATLLGEQGGLATAIVQGNRADVASREGRLQDALDLFGEARRRCEELGADGHAARLRVESGEALLLAGLFDEARIDLEAALPILERLGMGFEKARALAALARIDLQSSRFPAAVDRADDARSAFLGVANRRLADRAALLAIEACLVDGRLDAAEARLSSMSTADADDLPEATLVGTHAMQSMLADARGRSDEALAAARASLTVAEALGIGPLIIECGSRLASMQLRHDSSDAALVTARETIDRLEGLRAGFVANRLRSAFLASRTEAYEVLVSALVARGDEPSCREAFEVVERARSRGLLERLVGGPVDRLEGGDSEEISSLRRRLLGLYAAMDDDGPDEQRRRRSDTRQTEIDALEIRLDRLMLEVERRATPIDAAMPIEELTASLAPGEALVEFFGVGERMLAFTLLNGGLDGGLEVVSLPLEVDAIGSLVTELHFQCRRRLRGEPGPGLERRMRETTEKVLRQLHDAIVRPLPEAVRSASRWLVVPHGPLAAVPFHALLGDDGHVLDRTIVATAPSAAVAVRLATMPSRGDGVVVASVADDRAPAIREEGDRISATHAEVRRLDAESATADEVLAGLSTARIAHLACHGRFLPGSPRSSGLRFSDRWITTRDIHELEATPSVVVLSGCETGLHPQAGAHELLGLARAFAAGGSRAVVSSLWSVHDASTTRLMTEMHAAIAGGVEDIAEALTESQRRLRIDRPHPAHWAPFFCSQGSRGAMCSHR